MYRINVKYGDVFYNSSLVEAWVMPERESDIKITKELYEKAQNHKIDIVKAVRNYLDFLKEH